MALFWTIMVIALAFLEASTSQFICIWFAGGSFVSLILAICGVSVLWQCIAFVIASALFLALTKPIVKKLKKRSDEKTNVDALIGKTCVVKTGIDNIKGAGAVTLNGIEWSARSVDDLPIEEGAVVKVVKIEGVKLIVENI